MLMFESLHLVFSHLCVELWRRCLVTCFFVTLRLVSRFAPLCISELLGHCRLNYSGVPSLTSVTNAFKCPILMQKLVLFSSFFSPVDGITYINQSEWFLISKGDYCERTSGKILLRSKSGVDATIRFNEFVFEYRSLINKVVDVIGKNTDELPMF